MALATVAIASISLAHPCELVIDTSISPGAASSSGSPLVTAFAQTTLLAGGAKRLLVGGSFETMGGVSGTTGVALWDGTAFSPLGLGLNPGGTFEVNKFIEFNGSIYIGGQFQGEFGGVDSRGIIRWNPAANAGAGGYEAVNTDTSGSALSIRAMAVYKGELYVAGNISKIGTLTANSLAKYDPGTNDFVAVANWTGAAAAPIFDMVTFNDGSGEKLYICGNYSTVNATLGNPSRWVSRFDGTNWEVVGAGLSSSAAAYVQDMVVFDDGTGPALWCASRNFSNKLPTTGSTSSSILKWDGKDWTTIQGFRADPNATAANCNSLVVYNDGTGSTLLTQCRLFGASLTGSPRQRIWRLEGGIFVEQANTSTSTGDKSIFEMFQYDGKVWLGGSFDDINGAAAAKIARISGCVAPAVCAADQDGNDFVDADDLFRFLDDWFAANGTACP
jgi:hypothetical protein